MKVWQDLPELFKSVFKAGEAILEIYGQPFEVEDKSDGSPVTEADMLSDRILQDYLQTTGIPVMSEESPRTNYNIRKSWEKFWCVDPLDGTREFIKRNDQFAINIGLIENNQPVFGLIYHPVSKQIWYNSNHAVFRGILKEGLLKEKKALARKEADNVGVRRYVVSHAYKYNSTLNYIEDQARSKQLIPEITAIGASLKFCELAEGKADEYPRFAPSMEWDSAAGHAIVKAMGFSVIDLATKEELKYNKKVLKNNHFIVR